MNERFKVVGEVAGEWWANQLCQPEFNNGDESNIGAIVSMMATMNAEKVSNELRAVIKDAITNYVMETLTKDANTTISLYCDYSPDFELREALANVDVPSANFPWKTGVCVDVNGVCAHSASGKEVIIDRDGVDKASCTSSDIDFDVLYKFIMETDFVEVSSTKVDELSKVIRADEGVLYSELCNVASCEFEVPETNLSLEVIEYLKNTYLVNLKVHGKNYSQVNISQTSFKDKSGLEDMLEGFQEPSNRW